MNATQASVTSSLWVVRCELSYGMVGFPLVAVITGSVTLGK